MSCSPQVTDVMFGAPREASEDAPVISLGKVLLIDLTRRDQKVADHRQLACRVFTHGGTSVAHQRLVYPCRLPPGGRHRLPQDPTPTGLIPDTANEPRLLKPIEGERDGTAGQA